MDLALYTLLDPTPFFVLPNPEKFLTYLDLAANAIMKGID